MPWSQKRLIAAREEFVLMAENRTIPLTQLCARYGISRPTGYKWLARYREFGRAGLVDRSRRPHRYR